MAVTTITPLPDAPQRIDSPADFIVKADAHVAALTNWTDQVNTLGTEVEALNVSADASAVAAAASEASAVAAANFKGTWASLAGALNIPASVAHNNDVWVLLANVADVTTSEPGVTSDWLNVTGQAWEAVQTAAFTAEAFNKYPCNVAAGGFTVTLPAALVVGDTFTFHSYGADNTLTVARNSHVITHKNVNIDTSGDGSLTLSNGQSVVMVAVTTAQVEIS